MKALFCFFATLKLHDAPLRFYQPISYAFSIIATIEAFALRNIHDTSALCPHFAGLFLMAPHRRDIATICEYCAPEAMMMTLYLFFADKMALVFAGCYPRAAKFSTAFVLSAGFLLFRLK